MGKGDKKSKRGKIFRGSFGNSRPRRAKSYKPVPAVTDEKKINEEVIDAVKPKEIKTNKKKVGTEKTVEKAEKAKTEKKKTTKKKSTKKGSDKE